MKPGPLRQLTGAVGLVALVPTAVLLAQGAHTPWQAAVRALMTLVGVTVIGRIAAWWLTATAGAFERRTETATSPETGPATMGRRRDDPRHAIDAQGPSTSGGPAA